MLRNCDYTEIKLLFRFTANDTQVSNIGFKNKTLNKIDIGCLDSYKEQLYPN